MFGEMIDYLPIVIRIGAVVMALAILYDYIKRKWANALVETLRSRDAVSIDTAVSTSELEGNIKNARLIIKILLSSEYSSLRRVIKCVSVKGEDTQISKKRSAKLMGDEKWYLKMPELVGDDEKDKVPEYSLPYVLRDGGEKSRAKIIIGIVIVILFSELIIYFLPQIVSFFSGVSRFGND